MVPEIYHIWPIWCIPKGILSPAPMAKQAILLLGFAALFGIFLPWYRGLDFLDPVMIIAYACLSLLFVAPASAEAFASDREAPSKRGAFRTSVMVLAFGWGLAFLVLAAAIVTVNLTHWHGYLLAPSARLLASALLLSLTASIVVIGSCALLSRRFSAASVKGFIRLAYLIVLALLAFGSRFLPEHLRTSIAERMTSSGLTHFAFTASAVLAGIGVPLLAVLWRSGSSPLPKPQE